jgi:tRNA (guanine37-N1)-methyltransferase
MAGYDIIGNAVLMKFSRDMKKKEKLKIGEEFLKQHKQVSTVLEKSDKISGRLRTPETKFICGEKTKEIVYRENGCTFRFNVDSCYFSPRLAAERKEISEIVKKNENVLVMFAGVAPFPVVIAKTKKPKRVVSVELNRACLPYAKDNVKENKVDVEVVQADVKRYSLNTKEKFDRIVMARPNLKEDFLKSALKLSTKGTIIHYYGFYAEEDKQKLIDLIEQRAKQAKKKIKITGIKEAGDIGVRKYRYRVDFKVLS